MFIRCRMGGGLGCDRLGDCFCTCRPVSIVSLVFHFAISHRSPSFVSLLHRQEGGRRPAAPAGELPRLGGTAFGEAAREGGCGPQAAGSGPEQHHPSGGCPSQVLPSAS